MYLLANLLWYLSTSSYETRTSKWWLFRTGPVSLVSVLTPLLHRWFYHLTHSTWRKVQRYREDEDVKLLCIQLPQLRRSTTSPLRMHCKPPMYPPSMWNAHNISLQGGSGTNNVREGWNHAFSKWVGHAHPNVWRVIGSFTPYLLDTIKLRWQ